MKMFFYIYWRVGSLPWKLVGNYGLYVTYKLSSFPGIVCFKIFTLKVSKLYINKALKNLMRA